MYKLGFEKAEIKWPTFMDHRESITEKHLFHQLHKSLWLCGSQQTGKFLEMGVPDNLTCLLKNLYADQKATVRTGYETIDLFKIGKGEC